MVAYLEVITFVGALLGLLELRRLLENIEDLLSEGLIGQGPGCTGWSVMAQE